MHVTSSLARLPAKIFLENIHKRDKKSHRGFFFFFPLSRKARYVFREWFYFLDSSSGRKHLLGQKMSDSQHTEQKDVKDMHSDLLVEERSMWL